MKKFLILIVLLGALSCKSPSMQITKTQPDSIVETYKNRFATTPWWADICKNLDKKQEGEGVYKTSEGECVSIADYMVKEVGQQCNGKIQCEVEEMREARLQRVKNETKQFYADMEILAKLPICKGLKGGEKSKVLLQTQGYCLLPRSNEATIAAVRAYDKKLRTELEEENKKYPVKRNANQKPISRTSAGLIL